MLEKLLLVVVEYTTVAGVLGLGLVLGLILYISQEISYKWSWRIVYPVVTFALFILLFGQDFLGFFLYGWPPYNSSDLASEELGMILYVTISIIWVIIALVLFNNKSNNSNYFKKYTGEDKTWLALYLIVLAVMVYLPVTSVRHNPKYVEYWADYGHLTDHEYAEVVIRDANDTNYSLTERNSLYLQSAELNPAYNKYVITHLLQSGQVAKAQMELNKITVTGLPEYTRVYLQAMILARSDKLNEAMELIIQNEYPWHNNDYLIALMFEYQLNHGNQQQAFDIFESMDMSRQMSQANTVVDLNGLKYFAALGRNNCSEGSQYANYYGGFLLSNALDNTLRQNLSQSVSQVINGYSGDIVFLPDSISENLSKQLSQIVGTITDMDQYQSPLPDIVNSWVNSINLLPYSQLPTHGVLSQHLLVFLFLVSACLMIMVCSTYNSWLSNVYQFVERRAVWWQEKKDRWQNYWHDPDDIILKNAEKNYRYLMNQIPDKDLEALPFADIIPSIKEIKENLPRLIAKRKFLKSKVAELVYLETEDESEIKEIRQMQAESKQDIANLKRQIADCDKYIAISSETVKHYATNINIIVLLLKDSETEKAQKAVDKLVAEMQQMTNRVTETIEEISAA